MAYCSPVKPREELTSDSSIRVSIIDRIGRVYLVGKTETKEVLTIDTLGRGVLTLRRRNVCVEQYLQWVVQARVSIRILPILISGAIHADGRAVG